MDPIKTRRIDTRIPYASSSPARYSSRPERLDVLFAELHQDEKSGWKKAYPWLGGFVAVFLVGVVVAPMVKSGSAILYSYFEQSPFGSAYTEASANTVLSSTELATASSSDQVAPQPILTYGGPILYGTTSLPVSSVHEYSIYNPQSVPSVSAQAFLVADMSTGEILFEKNGTQVAPIASVSKLMTALVAIQNMNLSKIAVVSKTAYNTFGSEGGLAKNEKIRVGDLLYPLLIESSNDGAEVLAETFGHAAFMSIMNSTAKKIGMISTHYDDPSGLSVKNVSTVEDIFKLSRYIYQNSSTIWDITRIKQIGMDGHIWNNASVLLNIPYFLGGKNGFIDESKQTTSTIFNVPFIKGGSRPISIVVLKSDNRTTDINRLIDFMIHNVAYSTSSSATVFNTVATSSVAN